MSTWLKVTLSLLAVSLIGAAGVGLVHYWSTHEKVTVEKNEISNPPTDPDEVLLDDQLADKKPPQFDPELVVRQSGSNVRENRSAVVIRLNVSPILGDGEAHLLTLYPSYQALTKGKENVLPSVNMLDGKAKQFDDGLYAALDQAYYRGLDEQLPGHVQLMQRIFEKVGKDSSTAPFLAAGLKLAGIEAPVKDLSSKQRWLQEFSR